MANEKILQALGVVCELTGTKLSEAAARVFADDLSHYPQSQVIAALERCRRELKGRLTLAEVISRLEDGRPGPEEAWSMVMNALADERITIVWTEEMALASAPARALIDDPVAARMAFLEHYRKSTQLARDAGTPVKWSPCLGWDASGRDGPLLEAQRLGRLSQAHVAGLLTRSEEIDPTAAQLAGGIAKRLNSPNPAPPEPRG